MKVEKPVQEHGLGKARRPRHPRFEAGHPKRVVLEGLTKDSERIAHVLAAPSDDVAGFRGSGETSGIRRRQGVALGGEGLQPIFELAKRFAEMGVG